MIVYYLNFTVHIETYNVIPQKECDEIHTLLFLLKQKWISRNKIAPFYTIGATSYLDKPGKNGNSYENFRDQYNPLLHKTFKIIYKKLFFSLNSRLKQSVQFNPKFALPGFHIYLAHRLFKFSLGSIHCDLQYQYLNWDGYSLVDFKHPLSFTLVISLPEGGGGIRIWDLNYRDLQHKTKTELRKLFYGCNYQKIEYKTGWLYIHSGHFAHQISPMKNFINGDTRITLQGHALLCDNSWIVYW